MGAALFEYADGAVCDMPWEWRLHVLEKRVTEHVGHHVVVAVEDVYAMEHAHAGEMMSAVFSSGRGFPVVLVGGRIVCDGGIDIPAVLAALGETTSDLANDDKEMAR
jgi:hypothetical protein